MQNFTVKFEFCLKDLSL